MIEEKITISFNYQDFTFAQQVNDENEMIMEIDDKDGTLVCLYFANIEQIQKVIDNLYTQMRILKDAQKSSTEESTD